MKVTCTSQYEAVPNIACYSKYMYAFNEFILKERLFMLPGLFFFSSGNPPCHVLNLNSPDHRPLSRHSECTQLPSLEDPEDLNYCQLTSVGR